jgi:acyl carrier protein phosphodiesterase
MNYLAHAYLSFHDAGLLTGNMIADYVKGKKINAYPPEIIKGILLHRAIDQFTDQHQATQQIKLIFKPTYRLYAGAFADIVYDHFLATDTRYFAEEKNLLDFSQKTYAILDQQTQWFPDKFARMFPYMQEQNWLYNYRLNWGIQQSFGGLVRRAVYLEESAIAFELFQQQYDVIKKNYLQFFPELEHFVHAFIKNYPTD